jgi:hypothetical protein
MDRQFYYGSFAKNDELASGEKQAECLFFAAMCPHKKEAPRFGPGGREDTSLS